MSVLVDEHVPSVFVTALRSNGYEVLEAKATLGEGTDDERLLQYCGGNGHLLVTHDKTDFAGELTDSVDHAGVVVYTDANYLRDDPEGAVRTFERILAQYPPTNCETSSSGSTSGDGEPPQPLTRPAANRR